MLTEREFDTIIAALKMWQEDAISDEGIPVDYADIAMEHGDALSKREVIRLTTRLRKARRTLVEDTVHGAPPVKHTPEYHHAPYLYKIIRVENLRPIVDEVVEISKRFEFDAWAFRGNSGALLASPLALATGKTMIMVRKPDIKTHSDRVVEGDVGARRYIIVDDCVSSGATARAIVEAIKEVAPKAKCVGVLEALNLYRYKEGGPGLDTKHTRTRRKGHKHTSLKGNKWNCKSDSTKTTASLQLDRPT